MHEDVHDKLAGACVFVPTACLCMKMYMTSWQVRVVPTACLCMKMYMTSWQVCECPRFSFGFDNAYCLTHLCVLLVCACELRNHNEVA